MGNEIEQVEQNIINSFRLAKNDIIKLQSKIVSLSQSQERIMELLDDVRAKLERLDASSKCKPTKTRTKVVLKKVVSKPARKKYVGSTDTKVFHLTSARMSKMIKPKNRVYNNTKKYFTKLGFKPSKELLENEKKERVKKRKR